MKTLNRILPFTTVWPIALGLMTVMSPHLAEAAVVHNAPGSSIRSRLARFNVARPTTSPVAKTSPKGAEVQGVTGTATYQLPGGPLIEIKAGDVIPEGAVVNTSPGSTIDLFLGRNVGVLRVTEGSTLQIATLQQTDTGSVTLTQTKLVLQKGEILGDVHKQTPGSSFAITLPDGEVNTSQGRFQISNRALDNLAENAGGNTQRDVTESTVRFTEGQGSFSKGGQQFSFNGPGEYTPGSKSVTNLAPETKQMLARQFNTITAPDTDSTSDSQQVANLNQTVQPQDIVLSPTTGSSN